MKGKAKIRKIAKTMFAESLINGYPDGNKVRTILKIATSHPSVQLSKILKVYKHIIQMAIESSQIVVETAVPVSTKEVSVLLAKTGAKRISQKTNPKLIFGARIKHGDWEFDASLDAKLKQLTSDI